MYKVQQPLPSLLLRRRDSNSLEGQRAGGSSGCGWEELKKGAIQAPGCRDLGSGSTPGTPMQT